MSRNTYSRDNFNIKQDWTRSVIVFSFIVFSVGCFPKLHMYEWKDLPNINKYNNRFNICTVVWTECNLSVISTQAQLANEGVSMCQSLSQNISFINYFPLSLYLTYKDLLSTFYRQKYI